jgi:hypothetical protein
MGNFTLLAAIAALIIWVVYAVRENMRHRRGRAESVFGHHYIDARILFVYEFNLIPCTNWVDEIDVVKAFRHIQEAYGHLLTGTYQACSFNRELNEQEFTKTVFKFRNSMMVELGRAYATILHTPNDYGVADELLRALSAYRLPEKEKDFEISIITHADGGFELKRLDIKPTELIIDLFYNDDFREVDDLILQRLSQREDKGIVLLHGLPGTGKTSYLRYLIGALDKKVLFISPGSASRITNPEFIDILIDNPNSVLVIEDAENIILDRKYDSNSSVSNLLNLSDGLLSDCLNVQIICTFNNPLSMIDPALLRQGRLIARYEFGKLSTEKAQRLSDHLGYKSRIVKPMTVAAIANQHEQAESATQHVAAIGFKTGDVVMS